MSFWAMSKSYFALFFGLFTGKVKFFYVTIDDNGKKVACYKSKEGNFFSVRNGSLVMDKDGKVML